MEILWAPWRMRYIVEPKPDSCVFCVSRTDTSQDKEKGILYRGEHAFVILNRYPYNAGHLLIVPYRHTCDFVSLPPEEAADCMRLLQISTGILKRAYDPEGMNMGMNLGEAAGAGVREHLHFHLVPRWKGDTSFITVCGETRVLPQLLEETYARLRPCFEAVERRPEA